jgi:hypothetical protein
VKTTTGERQKELGWKIQKIEENYIAGLSEANKASLFRI